MTSLFNYIKFFSNSPPAVYDQSTSTGNGETHESVGGGRQMSNNPTDHHQECLRQWHQQSSHDFFNALLPPPDSNFSFSKVRTTNISSPNNACIYPNIMIWAPLIHVLPLLN